jgi:hypothetical protein
MVPDHTLLLKQGEAFVAEIDTCIDHNNEIVAIIVSFINAQHAVRNSSNLVLFLVPCLFRKRLASVETCWSGNVD